jgi:4'-phosphopantetheinyl transferase
VAEPSQFAIQVRCCPATPSTTDRALLEAAITADEDRQRRRFHHAADADRFLVGRGTLRLEVSRRIGIAPRDVRFETGPHGKPHVAGGTPHVNISHSGEVVLVALTTGAPIGVDVEQIKERFVDDAALGQYFSPREVAEMAQLPADLRVRAFFHTWTSRESIMKAVGAGFALPRDDFDVSVDPRCPPALLAARTSFIPWPSDAPAPLVLVPISVARGHVAMLAVAAAAGTFRVSLSSCPPS